MRQSTRIFPFKYQENYENLASVFLLKFGKRYFIWKGKSLDQSVNSLAEEIDRQLRLGVKPGAYANIIPYIQKGRIISMTVEVLFTSNDGKELIRFEQEQLDKAKEDPLCLNTSFTAHVPKWIAEGISPDQTLSKPVEVIKDTTELSKALKSSENAVKRKATKEVVPEKSDSLSAKLSALKKLNIKIHESEESKDTKASAKRRGDRK